MTGATFVSLKTVHDICVSAGTSQSVRFFGIPGLQGAGYVQVRTDNGTWGFVCDDGLDINVAKTVCKELCYTEYVPWLPAILCPCKKTR